MLLFTLAGLLAVYALQRVQGVLPLTPAGLGAGSPDSSFNPAVSFATNTNWQGYGGETTMSYLTQMLALSVQNFASAATGMAVAVALIRGFARRSAATIGNFWVDLTRTTLYILLPLSLVMALVLVSQGVVQTFGPYAKVAVVQPTQYDEPVTDKDGKPVLDAKGRPTTKKSTLAEQNGHVFVKQGVDHTASDLQSGGNMEGKEVRFGIATSALWAAATTSASNGSVNAMHDSFTPIGGLVPMWLIQLGEVVYGGVGSGLYGMLMFAIIAVFVAGLMVGRTPEYLGKKIEAYEMKMSSLVIF